MFFDTELFFGGLLGTEVPGQWEWAEWECHAVKLPSEAMSSVTVSDGVGITALFPQDGSGLQTGWEQAASTRSALLWLDTTAVLYNSVSPQASLC